MERSVRLGVRSDWLSGDRQGVARAALEETVGEGEARVSGERRAFGEIATLIDS